MAARVQSRLVGVAVGCEASDARDRTPREAWGDIETLASVFVLHDTPKFVALGVEYAISY